MRFRMQVTKTRIAAGLLGAACLASVSSDAAYLVLQDNRRVEAASVRINAQGDYVIRTDVGERTFPAAQVMEAVADKPAEFDQALALMKAGQLEQAIPVLEQIASQNRGLGWDDEANAVLGQGLMKAGTADKAAAALERVSAGFLGRRPDVRVALWDAMIAADRASAVEASLDEAIRGADRALAAQAQVKRGDVKMSRRQLEEAVLDYLRTVVLFEAQKEVQPEALFKAGMALRELRDARASRMFETLSKEYADSEYVSRIP